MPGRGIIKGRGHNYWWLRRGAGGRFRSLNNDTIVQMQRETAQYYQYAESLTLELQQTFEENEGLKAFLTNNLDGKPIEVFEAVRTYCIENGLVRACPDCNGRLWLVEERRCQTCGGKGYLNEERETNG